MTAQMTLEEALAQAISHHQAGRLGEAEAFYRAILQADPRHPQANHNLGFIAVQVGQPEAALPLFKLALDANPGEGQFWLSYANALLQSGKTDEARSLLAGGKRMGLKGPAVDDLEKRLTGTQETRELDAMLSHFSGGRLAEAEALARLITSKFPQQIVAWKVLGVILNQTGRNAEARKVLQQAIELSPQDAELHNVLGIVLKALGLPEEAAASYRRAIEIRGDYPEAHCNLGVSQKELGMLVEAERSYRKAIALNPDFSGAHSNLALLLQSLGRLAEADESIQRAIGLAPQDPDAHYNRGTILKEMGRLRDAESAFRRATELMPMHAESWCNLGIVLMDLGRFEESANCSLKAIEIRPEFAEAHYNLGNTMKNLGKSLDAEMSFRRAIEFRPDYVEAYNNLGILLGETARLDESAAAYRQALAIKPEYADAWSNLGVTLCQIGEMPAGIEAFRKAMGIDPGSEHAQSSLIFFMDLCTGFDTEALQKERRNWAAKHADPLLQGREYGNIPDPERVLRIGYVSGDFNNHSAANGFSSLLGNFDRSRFEIYAYSNSNQNDQVTESLQKGVSAWRTIFGVSDDEAAKLVRRDEIDILVDLSGFTKGNRLQVFARKPAPVQVSAMGYPTGTGMQAMDALLVDEIVVPPEEKHLYAEEIRYLPCVIDYSSRKEFPEINELPALSNGKITFGSFNRLVKISDDAYALWARLLQELPDSRLVMKVGELDDEGARQRVLRHFAGMENRITLLGKTSWLEHVRAYNRVDISLDPFPHGGGVTTIESIRMGAPVLTLKYPTFAGRASASILTNLGLTDWIAESEAEYLRIAIEKAENLAALAKLRNELRGIFAASILGDPDYYLRAAEKEYRALWREWCEKQSGAQ